MKSVRQARPVAGYVGGKRNLAARLVRRIEAIPHVTYAEPFTGMGGVFLARKTKPDAEVINDANGEVANLFRVLQRHYEAFCDAMRWQIAARREFERMQASAPASLTDIERAVRFLYLQRLAFGSKVVGQNFGYSPGLPASFNIGKLRPMLEALHDRLAGVTIECLDFADFIARYDRPGTLFYCDPPYWGSEGYYGKELFGRADFARLATSLKAAQGRFILSLNDTPGVRETFAGFRIETVETTYSMNAKAPATKAVTEVIISGGAADLGSGNSGRAAKRSSKRGAT